MTQRRIRLPQLLATATLVGATIAGGVIIGVVSTMLPQSVRADVQTALVLMLAALGVGTVGAAIGLGRSISRAIAAARAALVERARGELAAPLPNAWLGEVHDINSAIERLVAQLAKREAEIERDAHERGVLLDTISEGILQLDANGRVIRANPAATTLLGLTPRAHGTPISTQVRNAELRRILEAGTTGTEVPATEIALDDRRLLVSVRPLGTRGAGSGGAVVAFVDLTEVRRLEGVRRDFVANVSHELKTPLTSIRGYVETLLTDDALPADVQRQFLEVVQTNAERLQRIIDDLLDLSRLQSGGWTPEFQPVDASELVRDVWSQCEQRARQRGVTFIPPREHVAVLADPAGLRQVLSNLFENALRYTSAGGRIEVSCAASSAASTRRNGNGQAPPVEPGYIAFEVRDSGTGIPSDALPRIFERFYRVDPARSREEGGTGLGLSIVKHLVERMGGEVSAESELGKGTTIRFRLPAAS